MNSDDSIVTGYICGIDWQHEIGVSGMIGNACAIFNSLKELIAEKGCAETCGAVEIEIRLKKWVLPQSHEQT